LLRLLAAVCLIYLALTAVLYTFQRRLLYHPDRLAPSRAEAGLAVMEEHRLQTADGVAIAAWYSPPAKARGALLYLHGNAGNLGSLGAKLKPYLAAGLGVLAIDWRGYGTSQGQPSEDGLYEDGRAALEFLTARGIAPERIAIHGESLGSGVATKLAAGRKLAALILEAPFTSVADAAQLHYPYLPAKWLVKDRFDSLERIQEITAPILILHGEKDQTVPVEHGKRLLAKAGGKAKGVFYEQGGHADLFDLGAAQEALGFLEKQGI
jgi:fermentation-respiration switch protein FrsA (DUF1100 family)